jgi:hypothetical protein
MRRRQRAASEFIIAAVALLIPIGAGAGLYGITTSTHADAPVDAATSTSLSAKPSATNTATPSPSSPAPTPVETPSPRPSSTMTALDALDTIPVKGRAPKTGYDRVGNFGAAWLDVDGNGCDTRNDILARDLTAVTKVGSCTVLSGSLADKYTGHTIGFTRGVESSSAVQIDHVVALEDAWQSGAQQLDQQQRVDLANDPINLLAADGPTNASKGSSNAASWLPPHKAFRCEYVARQVSVKMTYHLWVTAPERDAMMRVLATCPGQAVYTSTLAHGSGASSQAEPAHAAVHPGAFCAPAGTAGTTEDGTAMTCGTTQKSPDRARWHQP